jgi:hypothetical protein
MLIEKHKNLDGSIFGYLNEGVLSFHGIMIDGRVSGFARFANFFGLTNWFLVCFKSQ